ncbi:MAG: hypothetical protein HRT91_02735 [Piscirickettsiaceae bacterium]|nr:hypothetical protein [Piscirickettsiaceae bacterium]
MCFFKPNSLPFYCFFIVPLILVILANIVFFALVVRVIRNKKSTGNITEKEQILVSGV